jgi:hypothetical protein
MRLINEIKQYESRARTIIFSTVLRVSESKSLSLEFSGSTLAVLISGSPTATRDHQCILLFLANTTVRTFLPFSSSAIAESHTDKNKHIH